MMRWKSILALFVAVVAIIAMSCSSSDAPPASAAVDPGPVVGGGAVTRTVGTAGGTVMGPAGASVTIPSGALAKDTAITISVAQASQYPALGGYELTGQVFAFEPHGLVFLAPVVITLPITAPSADLTALRSEPAGTWAPLGAQIGANAQITTSGFSYYCIGRNTPPVDAGKFGTDADAGGDAADAGGDCTGRMADTSAPTGNLSNMSGTAAANVTQGWPDLDLTTLVDGYAELRGSGSVVMHLTNYARGCGSFRRGINVLQGKELQVYLWAQTITAQTYTDQFYVANRSTSAVGATAGACQAKGGEDGTSPTSGSVTITALDAAHVAGSFSILFAGQALSSSFDVPFCAAGVGLSPPTCCVPGGS